MLGAFGDVTFSSCHIELDPGDALVLYSDGLLDIQIGEARVDEEWLAQVLCSDTSTEPREIVGRIKNTLKRLDAPLRDDVAIVALSRPPSQ